MTHWMLTRSRRPWKSRDAGREYFEQVPNFVVRHPDQRDSAEWVNNATTIIMTVKMWKVLLGRNLMANIRIGLGMTLNRDILSYLLTPVSSSQDFLPYASQTRRC
ncbi:hypothetical protein CVT25_002366 [Psilocybe cyanescens]|uniref:Uncharacterized protein n=1 Tax=Psilocybe cyanescens TaxID=93625 RepID=A0A409WKJ5_PSICY|nr:hypothetical protein CVT25_002366 [Psilocybe cyanescens]